ncbi:MAG TPA: hypothetical protein VFT65_17045 [Candidatus Angelobacter sp.]|nr:hypothetical protein [Candidatus Angelobacter sp.]HEU4416499.1 hypothetical protein [Candidatus Angelobacter sp.]
MSNQESRVLARKGARELTIEEAEYVSAAMAAHTNVCTAIMATATHTGLGDGDGCSDTDGDSHSF